MKTIIIIVELLASMSLAAQENISSILFSIEENNTKQSIEVRNEGSKIRE